MKEGTSLQTPLRARNEMIILVLFTLLVTVPFIFRPVHMDDAGFIEFARARQVNSLEIELHDYTFFGKENEVFIDTHPPLVSSYIALLIKVAGSENEAFLHLGFLVFPLITAFSMYYLSRVFTRYALLAALLLMATPGVIVMSHGYMSDMPGLSLWLASIALYIYGLKHRSLGLMSACGIVITLGVFTSYQVLSVIPLLLAYTLISRRFSLLAIIPLVLPLSSFLSYAIWHLDAAGFLPRFSYGVGEPLAWYSVVQKGGSAMLIIGGALIFFIVLMRVLLDRKWDFTAYLAFLIPLWFSFMVQYLAGKYSAAASILTVLFLPLGILLIYRVYADGGCWLKEEQRDKYAQTAFLLLWLTGVLFYEIVLLPYSSVRYMLPAFPVLILLFIRLAEDRYGATRAFLTRVLLVAVMTTAATGLLVAAADYDLASANRWFAWSKAPGYIERADSTGNNVWFVGEFGYRYYMEQLGLRELPKDTLVQEGDLIIQSPLADPRPFSEVMEDRVELIETIGYGGHLPLRVTNFNAEAGFYGHFWGLLPFSLALGNVEEYLVYEVVPPDIDNDDTGENGGSS